MKLPVLLASCLALPTAVHATPSPTITLAPGAQRAFVLHETHTQTRTGSDGKQLPTVTTSSEEELVFEPASPSGWRLHWTTRKVTDDDATQRGLIAGEIARTAVNHEIVYQLDGHGALIGVENLAGAHDDMNSRFSAGMAGFADRHPELDEAARRSAQAMLERTVAIIAGMPDGAIAAMLMGEPSRILLHCGIAATPGAFDRDGLIEVPLLNSKAQVSRHFLLTVDPGGTDTLTMHSHLDPASLSGMADAIAAKLPPDATAEQKARMDTVRTAILAMSVDSEMTLTFVHATAVPLRMEEHSKVVSGGAVQTEARTYVLEPSHS